MKEIDEWINWGKQNKKMIFFYQQQVLDLSQFVLIHPGGRKALSSYLYKDITDILFAVYPHKKANTLDTLSKYVIGTNSSFTVNHKSRKQNLSTNKFNRSKKKVCFESPTTTNSKLQQTSIKNQILGNSIKNTKNENSHSKKVEKKENRSKSKKYQVSLTIIPDKQVSQEMPIIPKSKKTSQAKREDIDSHLKHSQIEELSRNIVVPILNVKMAKER